MMSLICSMTTNPWAGAYKYFHPISVSSLVFPNSELNESGETCTSPDSLRCNALTIYFMACRTANPDFEAWSAVEPYKVSLVQGQRVAIYHQSDHPQILLLIGPDIYSRICSSYERKVVTSSEAEGNGILSPTAVGSGDQRWIRVNMSVNRLAQCYGLLFRTLCMKAQTS